MAHEDPRRGQQPQPDTVGLLSALAPRNETLQRANRVSSPNFFESTFGGPDDPRMNAEQTRQARQAAVLRAGFAGLLAAGQGANPLETLGIAGGAGIDTRLEINANFEPPAAVDRSTQVIEIVDKEDGLMHRLLIDKGDGSMIADLGVSETEDDVKLGKPQKVQNLKGDIFWARAHPDGHFVDQKGNIVLGFPVDVPPQGEQTTFTDEFGNQWGQFRNRETGETIGTPWMKKLASDDKDEKLKTQERVALATMRRRVAEIRKIYEDNNWKAFSFKDKFTNQYDLLRGVFTSDEFKIAAPAQKFVATAVLKAIQGSRPSDFDMKMYLDFIIPRVGDSPDAIKAKIRRLEEMISDYDNKPEDAFGNTLNKARADEGLDPIQTYFGENRGQGSAEAYRDRLSQEDPE